MLTQSLCCVYSQINFVPFSNESLSRIFETIVNWFLSSQPFQGTVIATSKAIVAATIGIYDTISAKLLPTPTKSHYTFNLRDLSKVFQGLTAGIAELMKTKEDFVRIWCHECMRVFHDRLVSDDDRKWFNGELGVAVKRNFTLDYLTQIAGVATGPGASVNASEAEGSLPLMFGNYIDTKAPPERRKYQQITDRDAMHRAMEFFLEDYNAMTTKPMSLVLFDNAIEHVSRISRIIQQPHGNALLMGVGGSGRKSLTTLAVSISEFKLVQIEISKAYGKVEWGEDLKRILMSAGAENKPTVFLFDDTQIVHESFLEDINLVLNTGEVPNLFLQDELVGIYDMIGRMANAAGVNTGSLSEMYKFFVSRCRNNLHIVLCLSPIGDAFRRRLRMFPALVNCCTIDWFTAWPEQALRSVAAHFLDSVDIENAVKQGVVDVVVDMQVLVSNMSHSYVAELGRHYYVTPTSYLELINTFKSLLALQRTEVRWCATNRNRRPTVPPQRAERAR